MLGLEEDAVAASWTVVDDRIARWQAGFDDVFALVAGRFAQADSRRRARMYLLGPLPGAQRKNSWTLAQQAGDLTPDGMQRLLNFYRWLRTRFVMISVGMCWTVLVTPAGPSWPMSRVPQEEHQVRRVQRQYSGTAERIENCQHGVFLTYVSAKGRALIDRELYLPVSWTDDRERCAESGIGAEVEFATKPVLAQCMLERLLDSGAEVGWFTADEAYGDNPGSRAWLEERGLNYVMAVSCDQRFTTPAGPAR